MSRDAARTIEALGRARRVRRVLGHRGTVILAGGVAAAVLGGMFQPVQAAPKEYEGPKAPRLVTTPIAEVDERPAASRPVTRATRLPRVAWPADGRSVAQVPSARGEEPRWKDSGGLRVAIARTAKRSPGAAGAGEVQVRSHGPEAAARLGLNGVLLGVAPVEATGPASVDLSVDATSFAGAVGGDWGSRLRLMSLPACALTTPDVPSCRTATPVAGSTADGRGVVRGTVRLPEATGKPDAAEKSEATGKPDATEKSEATQKFEATVLAVAAAASGGAGDYTASSLSASASWSAGQQSGSFGWSYPLRVPPALNGPGPQLGISYDSGSVDGRTASTNNQPSWLGEGFDLGSGFVERRYVSCQEDRSGGNNSTKTGDLCWKTDNATLSLAGHSSELIRDADSGAWRLKNEDGSRIERLTGASGSPDNDGEYWKLTTADGTQYFFGRGRRHGADPLASNATWTVPVAGNQPGEPCRADTFSASFCTQAWRWNIDHVVDPYGNTMSYFYAKERNRYGKEATTKVADYDRGGHLTEIHYGQRAGSENAFPPAKVVFTTAERCLPTADFDCAESKLTSANAARWPDVPFDQLCGLTATTCAGRGSPTFFTRKRLTRVTTQILGAGNTFGPVDVWDFAQEFPAPADGSPKGLSLKGITHIGETGSGSAAMPSVAFTFEMYRNRVEGLIDGPVMWKPRLTAVRNETGGAISVHYDRSAGSLCSASSLPSSPASNTTRCYPSFWTPEGASDPTLTWFYKYVVDQVAEKDLVGGGVDTVTNITYGGGAGWRYDDNELTPAKHRTWSEWRGYGVVDVRKGDDAATTTRDRTVYLRGLHGNRTADGSSASVSVADSKGGTTVDDERVGGSVLEHTRYNGGAVVETTITKPWISAPTGTSSSGEKARFSAPGTASTYTPLAGGGERVTRVTTSTDGKYGTPTQIDDEGDVGTAADDLCTRFTHARNDNRWITDTVSREQVASVRCGTPPSDTQVVADTRTLYDGLGFGAAPTEGAATETQALSAPGSYLTRSKATYDDNGRPITSTDAMGQVTRTTYRHRAVTGQTHTGGLEEVTTTDPKGFVAKSAVSPAWGVPVTETDINGRVTSLGYDQLGRLTGVWFPSRPKDANASYPNLRFGYALSTTAPAVVTSEELVDDSVILYNRSYQIFDGLLRPRQTQANEAGTAGGRVLSDVEYDSRGFEVKRNGPYYAGGAPSGTLMRITDVQKASSTELTYDRAGRVTRQRLVALGVEKLDTVTTYGGSWTSTDPSDGITPTTVWTDARDRATNVWKYKGNAPTGAYDETRYAYHPDGQLKQVRSPSGATWDHSYDQRGRLIRTSDPDKGVTTSTYNNADQVVTSTDARGTTIWTGYDALGRPTETRSGGATGTKLTERVYDTLAKGKPTSSTRFVGGNAYTVAVTGYDVAYRPLGSSTTIPASEGALAGTYPSTMKYVGTGQMTALTLPAVPGIASEKINMQYGGGQMMPQSLSTTAGGSIVAGVTRSPYGEGMRYTQGTVDSAIWTDLVYEEGTRRLTDLKVLRQNQLGASDVSLRYGYDKGGNVTSVVDSPTAWGSQAETQCFRYDDQQRLTEAWSPTGGCATEPSTSGIGGPAGYWHSYRYDVAGNRTSETIHSAWGDTQRAYTIPGVDGQGKGRPHALSKLTSTPLSGSATTVDYGYDAAGNMSSRTTAGAATAAETFAWDDEGRLASTTRNGQTNSSYVYDADGERLIKREDGKATLYLDGTEVELTTATGAVTSTRYYSFDGRTVAMKQAGQGLRVLVSDHQGSAMWSADVPSGGDVRRRRFTPFGSDRVGFEPVQWTGARGFVDGVKDSGTGLTHLGAREYDPSTGRFISVDPLMDPMDARSFNAYAYSWNNPVTFSDPSGLAAICPRIPEDLGACMGQGPVSNPGGKKPKKPFSLKGSPRESYAEREFRQAAQNLTTAKHRHWETKQRIVAAAKALGKVLMDELGITAGLDCFTRGDLGACAETAVNVLLGAVGGIGAKLVAKYGFRWRAGITMGKTVARLAGDLASGIKGWLKAGGDLKSAEKRMTAAADACPVGNSFDGRTRVRMADGTTKPIRAVKVGDKVLATDPLTGRTAAKPVTRLIVGSGAKKLVNVTVDTSTGPKSIIATDRHPFWNAGDRTWTDAVALDTDDRLLTPDGRTLTVTSTKPFTRHQTVYNLTVADIHTYYVDAGEEPVLVHNCTKYTSDQQKDMAEYLGYSRVRQQGFKAQVFELKKPGPGQPRFITRDIDQHTGGAFKGADRVDDLLSKQRRAGTFDADVDSGEFTGLKWIAE